jgi:hypothetical protein
MLKTQCEGYLGAAPLWLVPIVADRRTPKVGSGEGSRPEGCRMGDCEGGNVVRSHLAPEVEGSYDDREAMRKVVMMVSVRGKAV